MQVKAHQEAAGVVEGKRGLRHKLVATVLGEHLQYARSFLSGGRQMVFDPRSDQQMSVFELAGSLKPGARLYGQIGRGTVSHCQPDLRSSRNDCHPRHRG